MKQLQIFTTGGTIDKVYFDAKSQYEIGESVIQHVLNEAQVTIDFSVTALLHKDSLEVTEEDRQLIYRSVEECQHERVLITHGTDTMADTARYLVPIKNRVIVLTGSLTPARFRSSDAIFNIGAAVAAVQILPPGVFIAMNGQVFSADNVYKNREKNRFELKTPK